MLRQYTDWCDKFPLMSRGYSLPFARNTLVVEALKTKCTHIFWIDSDIVLENIGNGIPNPQAPNDQTKNTPVTDPNIALRILYDTNMPIVSGLYRAKQKGGFGFAAWVKVQDKSQPRGWGYAPIASWNGNLVQVDVVGLGFCLIKREVFEKMKPPWFKWDMPDEVSEDFSFLQKAKEAGFDTHLFTDIKLRHLGDLAVNWNGTFSVRDL